jgi:hypothetical protein
VSRRGRIFLLTLVAVAALGLGLGGCGSSSSTGSNSTSTPQTSSQPATSFAKTKFVLHAGLAFGAFHPFIYKPYKAGTLHGFGLVKAGLAGLFAYHEVKLALTDAKSSPLLSRLLSPLSALSAKLSALGTSLRGGSVDRTAIESTNTDVGVASAASQAAGQPISETTPSAAQLASG